MAEWSYFFAKSSIPRHATNYRVIVKNDDVEIEVGSIGVQFDGWHWGIDCIVPMREEDAEVLRSTRPSPTALAWACPSAARSSKLMGDGCGRPSTRRRVRSFSLRYRRDQPMVWF
jgi:hypothetical protein